MDREEVIDALNYIIGQLKWGYIDLGCCDEYELKVVKQAIKEYIINHDLEVNNYDA